MGWRELIETLQAATVGMEKDRELFQMVNRLLDFFVDFRFLSHIDDVDVETVTLGRLPHAENALNVVFGHLAIFP
jgi:hypothetical protein